MFIVKETAPGVFEELPPHRSFTAGDVLHPWQVAELWSDEDLAAIGIHRVSTFVIPDGKELHSYSFARVEDCGFR